MALLLAFGFLLAGCDSGGEEEPEVEEVIIVGTQVEQNFLSTGEFGLSATPLDLDGNSILNEDLEAEATLSTANGSGTSAASTNAVGQVELQVTVTSERVNTPSDDPLAISVNIDGSGSMYSTDPDSARIEGAKSFIDEVNSRVSEWEAAMFTYPGNPSTGFSNVELLQDFTNDASSLKASTDAVEASGGTPTYESLAEILIYSEQERPATSYRKSIVLLSDGAPNSTALRDSVCSDANRKDSPIYSIGLGPASDVSDSPIPSAVQEMRSIANCTGGAYAGIDPNDIQGSTQTIYNSIGTAASLGSVVFRVQVQSGLDQLTPGQRLNGTLTITSGGTSATGNFSFAVPLPSSAAPSSAEYQNPFPD